MTSLALASPPCSASDAAGLEPPLAEDELPQDAREPQATTAAVPKPAALTNCLLLQAREPSPMTTLSQPALRTATSPPIELWCY